MWRRCEGDVGKVRRAREASPPRDNADVVCRRHRSRARRGAVVRKQRAHSGLSMMRASRSIEARALRRPGAPAMEKRLPLYRTRKVILIVIVASAAQLFGSPGSSTTSTIA
jgi:hypothetical protein